MNFGGIREGGMGGGHWMSHGCAVGGLDQMHLQVWRRMQLKVLMGAF